MQVFGTARGMSGFKSYNKLNNPHAKVSDDNVRRWVLGAVQDVFWPAKMPRVNHLMG